MTTETDQTYNGWKNRETWAAALHLSNDEGLYDMCGEMARETVMATGDPNDAEWTITRCSNDLGDQLRDMWSELEADVDDAAETAGSAVATGLAAVLRDVGSSYRVEWADVAREYVAEAVEDLAESEEA